jgi:D-alanyl-D-alanine carboxypeptidase
MNDKFFYRAVAVLVTFLLISCIVAAFLVCDYFRTEDKPGNSITYTIGDTSQEYPADKIYSSNELMINFTDIAQLCGYTATGDAKIQKFNLTLRDVSESAEFTAGQTMCTINGAKFELTRVCIIENGELWLPLSFVINYTNGLDIKQSENSVSVARLKYEPGMSDSEIYLPLTFKVREQKEMESLGEGFAIALGNVSFKADLSEYEEYMNPADRDAFLLLVNENNLLDATYKPDDLTALSATRKDGRNTQYMREYAAKALEAMYIEMAEYGITDVSVTSAYRSYEYQNQLFKQYLDQNIARYDSYEEAYAATRALSALPGTSEHQSGLCCDMHNLPSASESFKNKEAYAWLKDNCYKFGFIIRYPEDKTDITGYDFEPWHYRYVGRYHATMMHEYNMCLEEYIEFLEKGEN